MPPCRNVGRSPIRKVQNAQRTIHPATTARHSRSSRIAATTGMNIIGLIEGTSKESDADIVLGEEANIDPILGQKVNPGNHDQEEESSNPDDDATARTTEDNTPKRNSLGLIGFLLSKIGSSRSAPREATLTVDDEGDQDSGKTEGNAPRHLESETSDGESLEDEDEKDDEYDEDDESEDDEDDDDDDVCSSSYRNQGRKAKSITTLEGVMQHAPWFEASAKGFTDPKPTAVKLVKRVIVVDPNSKRRRKVLAVGLPRSTIVDLWTLDDSPFAGKLVHFDANSHGLEDASLAGLADVYIRSCHDHKNKIHVPCSALDLAKHYVDYAIQSARGNWATDMPVLEVNLVVYADADLAVLIRNRFGVDRIDGGHHMLNVDFVLNEILTGCLYRSGAANEVR